MYTLFFPLIGQKKNSNFMHHTLVFDERTSFIIITNQVTLFRVICFYVSRSEILKEPHIFFVYHYFSSIPFLLYRLSWSLRVNDVSCTHTHTLLLMDVVICFFFRFFKNNINASTKLLYYHIAMLPFYSIPSLSTKKIRSF